MKTVSNNSGKNQYTHLKHEGDRDKIICRKTKINFLCYNYREIKYDLELLQSN